MGFSFWGADRDFVFFRKGGKIWVVGANYIECLLVLFERNPFAAVDSCGGQESEERAFGRGRRLIVGGDGDWRRETGVSFK
jgi:hypothetical protein